MKIVIKTKNVKLTPLLREFIEEKIDSLEKFAKRVFGESYYGRFFGKGKPKVEAWMEIGKTTLHHQKGLNFFAECQMRFPGKSIRALSQAESLERAVVDVKDELQIEIKKYKERLVSQTKRRARVLKKELKLSPSARFYRKGRIRQEGI